MRFREKLMYKALAGFAKEAHLLRLVRCIMLIFSTANKLHKTHLGAVLLLCISISGCIPIRTPHPEAQIRTEFVQPFFGETRYLSSSTRQKLSRIGCAATGKFLILEYTKRHVGNQLSMIDSLKVRNKNDIAFEIVQMIVFHGLNIPKAGTNSPEYSPNTFYDISIVSNLVKNSSLLMYREAQHVPINAIYKAYLFPYWEVDERNLEYKNGLPLLRFSYDTGMIISRSASSAMYYAAKQETSKFTCQQPY